MESVGYGANKRQFPSRGALSTDARADLSRGFSFFSSSLATARLEKPCLGCECVVVVRPSTLV